VRSTCSWRESLPLTGVLVFQCPTRSDCRHQPSASVILVVRRATKVTGQQGPRIRRTTGSRRGSRRCLPWWPPFQRPGSHAAPGPPPHGPTRPHRPVPAARSGPPGGRRPVPGARRLRHRDGQHAPIGAYDQITWDFITWAKVMAPPRRRPLGSGCHSSVDQPANHRASHGLCIVNVLVGGLVWARRVCWR